MSSLLRAVAADVHGAPPSGACVCPWIARFREIRIKSLGTGRSAAKAGDRTKIVNKTATIDLTEL